MSLLQMKLCIVMQEAKLKCFGLVSKTLEPSINEDCWTLVDVWVNFVRISESFRDVLSSHRFANSRVNFRVSR